MRWLAASAIAMAFGFAAQAADVPDSHASIPAIAKALRDGLPQAAEREASAVLDTDTITQLERAHVLLNRALAREALGKQQDALADFNNAIWLNILPENEKARALFDRGVTLDELGRTPEAVANYSAALAIEPAYAAALNNRANAERRLGQLAAAKADYQASLAAGNAQKKYPYFGLGEIAVSEGDTATAANDFRAALAEDASFTIAAERLAALKPVAPPAAQSQEPVKAPQPKPSHAPKLRGIEGARATRIASLDALKMPRISGDAMLQLGAFRGEAAAQNGWKTLQSETGNTLAGLAPRIVVADISGKGRFWRLRVGPLDKERAASICKALRAKGANCMAVRE
ncbi:MAG TPA: SPOR domain-containing protein [Rhizomicrobium sp.]